MQLSGLTEARKEIQPLNRESRSSAAREVDFIKKKPGAHKTHHHRRGQNAPSSHLNPPVHKKYMYCGRDQHSRDACPAKSATCKACSKRGHYAIVCRSTKRPNHKTVHQVSDTESEEDLAAHFLGSVDQDFEFDNYWTATLSVDGHPTVFKLDTGTSVSVISSKEPWLQGQQLQPSRKILRGPGGSTLSSSGLLGTLTVNLSYHGRTIKEKVYILRDRPCSLISKRACVELGMVKRIDTLANTSTPDFRGEFPGLFSGLGTINTSYKITAREEARPVCIHAPGKIAHPLIPKVKTFEFDN